MYSDIRGIRKRSNTVTSGTVIQHCVATDRIHCSCRIPSVANKGLHYLQQTITDTYLLQLDTFLRFMIQVAFHELAASKQMSQ